MRLKSAVVAALMGSTLMATAACTTDPVTGEQRISKAAIGGIGGALGGYLLGDLVGGRNDRTEKILGAGIGAVAGAGIGAYMDCLLYTSPSPRDYAASRMPSSA